MKNLSEIDLKTFSVTASASDCLYTSHILDILDCNKLLIHFFLFFLFQIRTRARKNRRTTIFRQFIFVFLKTFVL